MNAAQEDELLALASIFPSSISHTTSVSHTRIRIALPTINLGEDQELQVWDWEEPAAPIASTSGGGDTARRREHGAANVAAGTSATSFAQPDAAPGKAARRPRHRGRGRGGKAQPQAEPHPLPRSPPRPPVPLPALIPIPPSSPPALSRLTLIPAPRSRTPSPPPQHVAPPCAVPFAKTLRVRYLPPIILYATVRAGYPEDEPPDLALIDDEGWLSADGRRQLEEKLNGVWANEECLWVMVDMLQEIVATLDLTFPLILHEGHGTQTPCAIPQSTAIVSRYLSGSPSDKADLELRYGAANIRRLVDIWEEERVNREYMEKNSMTCPGCRVQIEKSVGCSHMLCVRCQTHFCFRCGERLSAMNPYAHYSTPSIPCYNKLFDFLPGQEPQPEEWLDIIGDDA
ncbi:hypothetical protein P7C70_g1086, partial [Phenoliferia sp. Uapishka_3]